MTNEKSPKVVDGLIHHLKSIRLHIHFFSLQVFREGTALPKLEMSSDSIVTSHHPIINGYFSFLVANSKSAFRLKHFHSSSDARGI